MQWPVTPVGSGPQLDVRCFPVQMGEFMVTSKTHPTSWSFSPSSSPASEQTPRPQLPVKNAGTFMLWLFSKPLLSCCPFPGVVCWPKSPVDPFSHQGQLLTTVPPQPCPWQLFRQTSRNAPEDPSVILCLYLHIQPPFRLLRALSSFVWL